MNRAMRSWIFLAAAAVLGGGLAGCAEPPAPDAKALHDEVRAAETSFAKSMADRDFAAFSSWVADDAVFINGGKPLRGKAEVLAHWKRFFERPAAPFSWKPEIVEVPARGDLGYTEGPVTLANGRVSNRFYTTWRRGGDGRWQVVFDNGYEVCQCPKP